MKLQCIVICGISLIVSLSSCTNEGKQEQDEFGKFPAALADSLRSIGQEIQQISIEPLKDNLIRGKNGTTIYIGANSLVGSNGEPISSKVIIELKELFSMADYILSNLQTIHNRDILQTQGMIYLTAKTEDGASVSIDKSKPIRIEIPIRERVLDAKIFTGKRDENGNLNWSEINEPSKLLVPYPIHFISNRGYFECSPFYGITLDTIKNEHFNYYGVLSKFENTFLATREFRERYEVACWKDVMKIYIDNLDKNLWEADELVFKHFIEDSIKWVSYEFNRKPVGLYGGRPTKEQEEAHKEIIKMTQESHHKDISAFKEFAKQRLTKIDQTKKVADTTVAQMSAAFVAYDALEFGWVNVDYFYKDPNSSSVRLAVKTNEPAPLINLIIPNRNVILSGMGKEDNYYLFSKNEDGYNKLPKGEKAVIVAFSIADNRMHFAVKEIVIGQMETESIELKATSAGAINAQLKKYNK